jgi:hypothetical protein
VAPSIEVSCADDQAHGVHLLPHLNEDSRSRDVSVSGAGTCSPLTIEGLTCLGHVRVCPLTLQPHSCTGKVLSFQSVPSHSSAQHLCPALAWVRSCPVLSFQNVPSHSSAQHLCPTHASVRSCPVLSFQNVPSHSSAPHKHESVRGAHPGPWEYLKVSSCQAHRCAAETHHGWRLFEISSSQH